MATSTQQRTVTVALIGNPNTGKSTLFNALSGMRQRVGNYPGVTVEKKVGYATVGDTRVELIDLPGTYSLAPHSPDEMVSVDVLLGRIGQSAPPDVVICIVDASNLERNLYLVSQVLEFERPTILALNMSDVARRRGIRVDIDALQRNLDIPVVELQANRRIGLHELRAELAAAIDRSTQSESITAPEVFPETFQQEVEQLQESLGDDIPHFLVERLVLDTSGYMQQALQLNDGDWPRRLAESRTRLKQQNHPVPAVEAMARYAWVEEVLGDGAMIRPDARPVTFSDRIDRIMTNRLWGTLAFLGLMILLFSSVFSFADFFMGWIGSGFEWIAGAVDSAMADGALKSLAIDGVIAGVGGVLVFLPQIFILFFFIAVLEDCGYMARAAYLMDKLMVRAGLSGKSFIPLLSSFACAIPGIMATRVIESRRDRLTTILVAPLMSCSARLPVYALLIAAFIPNTKYLGGVIGLQGITMFAMYMIGIVVAVVVALILKKTFLKGETPSFVMELPSYKVPSIKVVLHRMLDRGWAFIRRAGTLIFAVAIIVWAAAYYPRDPSAIDPSLSEKEIDGEYLRQSYLGRAGRAIEPAVRPLGWDWRIGAAAIASFPAREVVVGTMGVIYNLGSETDEESVVLHEKLKSATWDGSDELVFSIPVALSLMVFFALCAQCAATLAVIRRETASWRWPIFTFVYMTGLAYVAALATYQIGSWISV